ncbi:galectin-3-like isoform X2 [Labeo rohita]|uniref:Galectin n=1 Tax=Labeo rohita TaxID=84645 RepID=A0A498N3M1_LABRO|nr:galectin-3-like isoform X2 [Labeo rohita]RXN27361.1 galectin-3-like isoform X2 [Labeo rohita]
MLEGTSGALWGTSETISAPFAPGIKIHLEWDGYMWTALHTGIMDMPLTSHSQITSRQEAPYGPANQPPVLLSLLTPPGLVSPLTPHGPVSQTNRSGQGNHTNQHGLGSLSSLQLLGGLDLHHKLVLMTVPFDLPLQSGAYNKMVITIVGEVKPNAKHFTVNLNRGNDIAFHLNPRFNEGGKQAIVRNSMIGNKWGGEERELSSFPFVLGKPFELKILCTDTEYKVAVNKSHLLEYKHRIRELNQIRGLSVYNDVILNSVNVETLQ